MRLVDGPDLATVLGDGPLEPERAVAAVEQVAGPSTPPTEPDWCTAM
jgi:hypothetical protein